MQIKLFLVSIIFVFNAVFAMATAAHAADKTPQLVATSQQLAVERARNALLITRLQALQTEMQQPSTQTSSAALQSAALTVSTAQVDLNSINLTILSAQQALKLAESTIRILESEWQTAIASNASSTEQNLLQQQLKEQRALLLTQQTRMRVLQQTQQLAQQILAAAQDWQIQLQTNEQLQQQHQRQRTLDQIAIGLQQEQQEWLTRLASLDKQLHSKSNDHSLISNAKYARLSMGVFEAEERSNLSQIKLDLAKLRNHQEDLAFFPGQVSSLSTLNIWQYQINTLQQQLKSISELLKNKLNLLQERIQITKKSLDASLVTKTAGAADLAILHGLQTSYQSQLATVEALQQKNIFYGENIAAQLKLQLANRQVLPGFNARAWWLLGKKILEVPLLTWQALESLLSPLKLAVTDATLWIWSSWFLAMAMWLLLWRKLHTYLCKLIVRFEKRQQEPQHQAFWAGKTILISIQLLKSYLPELMLVAGLIGLLFLLNIPLKVFSLVIGLAFVYLGFGIGIRLARLVLLENVRNVCGHDVRLYYRLRWALFTGGMVTALTLLVHQLPVAYEVQDLLGRLFMLFLLVVATVLFKGWEVVPRLLEPYFAEGKRSYVRQMVRWLSLLIPLSLLINAVIGLIGYVELAWTIAAYQGLFLIIFTSYLFARGLLDETVRSIAEKLVRYVRNGWLWREALLKPLHQILKIGLFLGAWIVLFSFYGWDKESLVITALTNILSFHLFTLANTKITLITLIEIVLIIIILGWAARWTREFSYRWLFARTKDLGLRNSLAIFTQYTLVIIGVITGLDILGLNLTALTFIASAFAVGVGFGLRDLANNFACGVLLLLERPVKVGDWITTGIYEGQVLHIGARSITVLTNDHQELLVPNADVFSKLFINWTRRDSIIRSVVMLKINREDDPHRVREIILDVIKTIPSILTQPPCEVYFKEIDSMLLEFKVDYYVDIHGGDMRSTIRSEFLFALWDRFKAEGVRPPEYPHEILLHSS